MWMVCLFILAGSLKHTSLQIQTLRILKEKTKNKAKAKYVHSLGILKHFCYYKLKSLALSLKFNEQEGIFSENASVLWRVHICICIEMLHLDCSCDISFVLWRHKGSRGGKDKLWFDQSFGIFSILYLNLPYILCFLVWNANRTIIH